MCVDIGGPWIVGVGVGVARFMDPALSGLFLETLLGIRSVGMRHYSWGAAAIVGM